MKYRALKTFAGVVSMRRNEEKDIENQEVVNDLLKAGYIEAVADEKAKTVKSSRSGKNKGGADDE